MASPATASPLPPAPAPPLELYGRGLEAMAQERDGSPSGWRVRFDDGTHTPMALRRWLAPPTPEEREILDRVPAPVLDVGCGPGRHVHALAQAGTPALGIDVAPAAIRLARLRGGTVLRRSVFGPVPATGWWRGALLLDGNIGIGGAPAGLLRRIAALLRPGGRLFVELEGTRVRTSHHRARIEAPGHVSDWFPWARVGIADLDFLATASGFAVAERWHAGSRWFARLVR